MRFQQVISLALTLRKPEAIISWITSRAEVVLTNHWRPNLQTEIMAFYTCVDSASEWFMKWLEEILANIDTAIQRFLICDSYSLNRRSKWPRGLRCRSVATRLLKLWVRIPPGAWIRCLLCFVRHRSLGRTDHSSRGVLPTVVRRLCVI